MDMGIYIIDMCWYTSNILDTSVIMGLIATAL
jgi:hypothetical protein